MTSYNVHPKSLTTRRLHRSSSCGDNKVSRRSGKRRLLHAVAASISLLLLAQTCPQKAAAQATDAAHQNVHMEAFALGTYYQPSYQGTTEIGHGVTGGFTTDWNFPYVRPGFETRVSYTSYSFMSQRLVSVGPHVTVDFGRFHPYADYLIGYGVANFNHASGTYRGNNSTVYSMGGGVNVAVARFWALQLDYQHEKWDFDEPFQPFMPQAVSVGAHYLVHFHKHGGPE